MAEGDGGEVAWLDDLASQVRELHAVALGVAGGAPGEHTDRLLASLGRAFQTFGGDEVFPTDFEKAAALFHGIIRNHAFADGNKRTASVTVLLFLIARGAIGTRVSTLQIRFIGDLAVETATSRLDVDEVARWLHRILDP